MSSETTRWFWQPAGEGVEKEIEGWFTPPWSSGMKPRPWLALVRNHQSTDDSESMLVYLNADHSAAQKLEIARKALDGSALLAIGVLAEAREYIAFLRSAVLSGEKLGADYEAAINGWLLQRYPRALDALKDAEATLKAIDELPGKREEG